MDKSFGANTGVRSPRQWSVPGDIVVIVLFVAVSGALVLGIPGGLGSLRAVFALPLVLLAPGYVAVSALYPRRYTGNAPRSSVVSDASNLSSVGFRRAVRTRPLTWTERLALSFGLSLAAVPVVGLGTAVIAGSLSPPAVLAGLSVFVLVGALVATLRRNAVPANERFRVPVSRWRAVVRESVFGHENRLDGALSALLLVSVLVAAGAFGFALVAPQQAEAYTSTTLLAENADGEFVASDFPSVLTEETGDAVALRVENHEGAPTEYAVVVELQRVDTSGESATVTASEELARRQRTVSAGDSWRVSPAMTPTMSGEDLRLTYLVYQGTPPANPDAEDAYRRLFLWVDVPEAAS